MPHRDPETGQFLPGDGPAGDMDYTDFEYESHFVELGTDGTGGSAGADTVAAKLDPLDAFGGLESDEVAELVAVFYALSLRVDTRVTAASGGTRVSAHAGMGANLTTDEWPVTSDVDATAAFEENNTGASVLGGDLRAVTEPGIFWLEELAAAARQNDTTNGVGTGPDYGEASGARLFRATSGRGPILDPTDDIEVWATLGIATANLEPFLTVSTTMVWDTAEVSDKRSRFSVP